MVEPDARLGADHPDIAALTSGLLARLRDQSIRVHAITNAAAQTFTANLLLAAGAVPSLTTAPEEVPFFTGRAGALLVNLGTLDAERRTAIPWAIATARASGLPWLLDPVFVEASPPRLALAQLCLAGRPAVVRCNAFEFRALSGGEPTSEALRRFARAHGCVLALTGPVDQVTDGERFLHIENGHPLMTRVTAMGCAGTALIAALAGAEPDPFVAAASGLLALGVAGEVAGEAVNGPGSFQPAFLDALSALSPETLARQARFAWETQP